MTPAQVERVAWIVGGVGVVGSAIGWVMATSLFAGAWLAAVTFWLFWPLGSMGLLLIHGLTGGRWGALIRPQLLIATATLPLALPAIIPILLLVHTLYPWAGHDAAQTLHNTRYLNPGFYYGRVCGYVVLWVLMAAGLVLLLRRRPSAPLYRLAPPGLALLFLSVTFAGIDMTLSREPHFNSTAYGMVMASEALLFALAIAVFLATLMAVDDSEGLEQLGKLLLAALLLWGYLTFVQFLIVWNSNLAIDAPWYVHRAERGWGIVAYIVFVLHFFVPLLALLFPFVQRSREALMAITLMIIVSEIPRAWWLVVPSSERSVSWIDGLAMLAAIGIGTGLFLAAPRWIERLLPQEASHA